MPVTLRANTDLVAIAWLGAIPGLTPAQVGTTLPTDTSAWSDLGFVQAFTVGGSPNMYTPLRSPVLQVDCWAANLSSNKAPWGKANHLAELVWAAAIDHASVPRVVELPGNYPAARVMSAYVLTEPRRIFGDEANYARYQLDLAIHWVELS